MTYPHYSDLDCSHGSLWPYAQTLYCGCDKYRYWIQEKNRWSKWYYLGSDEIPLPWPFPEPGERNYKAFVEPEDLV